MAIQTQIDRSIIWVAGTFRRSRLSSLPLPRPPYHHGLRSTSSAAGFLNMITVQHTQIRCCRVVYFGVALAAAEPQSSVNSSVPNRFRDSEQGPEDEDDDDPSVPGMVVGEEETACAVHKALVIAQGEAFGANSRTGVETATE
ncbi:hypothetical protein C8J57DRAFT_1233751 [Mycena rebaudengoi]|nr:hypothetical protein C8J57DRAFT_1233751 [Mycena rebaudengoi]